MRWLLSLPILLAQVTFLGWQGGCLSWANREGPNVTCAELRDGATNACSDGIIATCAAGRVTYEVCDDKNACDASWQKQGQFQCEQGGVGGTGGAGTGGTGGANASGAGGASAGGSGGGGAAGSTSLASAVFAIDAIAVDADTVFFSDCEAIYSVPKAGGFPATVASANGCATGNMLVDGDMLYALQGGEIVRLPKTGGTQEVVVPLTEGGGAFALDEASIYWLSAPRLSRKPKAGGSLITMSTSVVQLGMPRLVVREGYAYWLSGSAVSRVATSTEAPVEPASVPLGQGLVRDFGIDGTGIYFTAVNDDNLGGLTLLTWSGNTTTLLDTGAAGPGPIVLDGTNAYWRDSKNIREVPKAGGATKALAAVSSHDVTSERPIAVDDSYVFYADENKLMRVAK